MSASSAPGLDSRGDLQCTFNFSGKYQAEDGCRLVGATEASWFRNPTIDSSSGPTSISIPAGTDLEFVQYGCDRLEIRGATRGGMSLWIDLVHGPLGLKLAKFTVEPDGITAALQRSIVSYESSTGVNAGQVASLLNLRWIARKDQATGRVDFVYLRRELGVRIENYGLVSPVLQNTESRCTLLRQ